MAISSTSRLAKEVRSHWGIKKSLRWDPDATFRADDCRVRKGHSDANLRVIRIALRKLKSDKSKKLGKNKRLLAACDTDDLARRSQSHLTTQFVWHCEGSSHAWRSAHVRFRPASRLLADAHDVVVDAAFPSCHCTVGIGDWEDMRRSHFDGPFP